LAVVAQLLRFSQIIWQGEPENLLDPPPQLANIDSAASATTAAIAATPHNVPRATMLLTDRTPKARPTRFADSRHL
jgi:hypothetical protein